MTATRATPPLRLQGIRLPEKRRSPAELATRRWVFVFLACLAITGPGIKAASTGSLILYPRPEGLTPSPLYQVKVNGSPSFVYPVKVNPTGDYRNASEPAGMTYFDFDGTATVEITAATEFTNATVHPLSRGVQAAVAGRTVSFQLTSPGNFVVWFNNSRRQPLFIFAGPREPEAPKPGTPGVVYFGPGVHSPGLIELGSGQTLYLAGGAFVKGRIKSSDASNVKILGRGILYGGEFNKQAMANEKFVVFRNGRDIHIEGIILLDAFAWNVMIAGSQKATVDNVKIISWRINSDGIDPVSSKDVVIQNCFIKNHDDGISIKGLAAFGEGPRNITVTRCVMWQNWMRSFVVGGELAVKLAEKIVFRDSDILYSGINPKSAGNRDAALSVWNVDAALVRDVLFENIRVEYADRLVRVALFKNKHSRQPEWGHIEGVTFRNLNVLAGPAAIELSGHSPSNLVQNVTFENLELAGRKISRAANLDSYSAEEATRDVKFIVTK